MEFNYLLERGALKLDDTGHYFVDVKRMRAGVAALLKELLEIQATGDRARAEALFAKYGTVPDALRAVLAAATDVPVDVIAVKYPHPEYADEGLPRCEPR